VALADPVHPDWKERIEHSIVINLCVRRACHYALGGFLVAALGAPVTRRPYRDQTGVLELGGERDGLGQQFAVEGQREQILVQLCLPVLAAQLRLGGVQLALPDAVAQCLGDLRRINSGASNLPGPASSSVAASAPGSSWWGLTATLASRTIIRARPVVSGRSVLSAH
jgi:hypothetical protein